MLQLFPEKNLKDQGNFDSFILLQTMPALICDCCEKSADDNKFISCVICKGNFYYSCAELTLNEIKSIKNKVNLKYNCKNCLKFGEGFAELKALIISLQNEVAELKKVRVDSDSEQLNYEEIIQEVSDRNSRRQNIIVYGVVENYDLSKQEQNESDKGYLKTLFQHISPEIEPNNLQPIRLGKFDQTRTRPRPIKIIFASEQQVTKCLRNANKLNNNNDYANVRISADRTPKQIEHYKKLKAMLSLRLEKGEKNLKIKYVQGSPRIVSVN